MLKISDLTVAVLATEPIAHAQIPGSAGAQIQQIPPAPTPPQSIPELRIDRRPSPVSSEPTGETITVSTLRVSGQTRFTEAQLIAVAGFRPGVALSLSDLRAMAARITAFYGRNGYFVAQAYVPAQNIEAGAVTIVAGFGLGGGRRRAIQDRLHIPLCGHPRRGRQQTAAIGAGASY